jgi:redox-sensitive bicupin YhaK (pirin superfamily)
LIPARLLDWSIEPGTTMEIDMPDKHSCFGYVYEGSVTAPGRKGTAIAERGMLALLEGSGPVQLTAGPDGAKVLLADAMPLREPVARYGPFVMNTRAELVQAFEDYSSGKLDRVAS